jgi:uncharacterized membrane protein
VTNAAAPEPPSLAPIHIEETIGAIARLHAEHRANTTRHQRIVDRITAALGRPRFLVGFTCLIAAWMGGNEGAALLGRTPIDPPPFPGLAGVVSLASLYFVVLILTTQRRDDGLSRRRELLTLELAILSEQKTAKIVALLEELRRDSPEIHDRIDEQADVMARPADPQSVIEAIHETRSEASSVARASDGS